MPPARRPDLVERVRIKRHNARVAEHATVVAEAESERVRDLVLQLKASRQREKRAFDAGFEACRMMVAHGATMERLREAQGIVVPDEAPDVEHEPEDTDVDAVPHG